MEPIATPEAPAAIGPYSQAIRAGNMLFLSGQIPLDAATSQLVTGDVREETAQVLANLRAVLVAAGATLGQVVKTTIYLTSMSDFAAVNEVYASAFREPYPARATVEVSKLPRGARVEIEAIAILTAS